MPFAIIDLRELFITIFFGLSTSKFIIQYLLNKFIINNELKSVIILNFSLHAE